MMKTARDLRHRQARASSSPQMVDIAELGPGEIGVFTASIKQVRDTRVGDTITHEKRQGADTALPGFKPSQSRSSSAASSPSTPPSSRTCATRSRSWPSTTPPSPTRWRPRAALGFGFRCGFLGLLHLEVIRDRLEREYDIDLITTAPSVVYHLHMQRRRRCSELHNPADMPDLTLVDHIEEPRIKATILVPDEYLGDVLKLCQDRRGIQLDLTYAGSRADGRLRPAAERGGLRLLRPAEIGDQGLCQLRLPAHRLPRGQPREDADPGERRAGGRAVDDGPPRPGRDARPRDGARS